MDLEILENKIEQHGEKTVEILKQQGYDIPEMFQAILSHTEGITPQTPYKRQSRLDYCLAASENIT